ncbi:MAG: TetR/AcrR family transcriptional regulator [Acidobacteria bacterium]|nr:TetR/AcrR family transcriptional regulator [Acidobacteriota bacterium]
MSRPRTLSDDDLLAATHRVVGRLGPNLTLADVAREAGVSAATLVQRFGSKRGLLLAFASLGSEGMREQFDAIRTGHSDPLDALRETVRCYAQMAPSPDAVSNALAFLQMDLTDPDFHRPALLAARATVVELQRILDDAVRARRLGRCNTKDLALALHAIIGGAMVAWAVLREGTAESMMQAAVDTLLEPRVIGHRRNTVHRGKRPAPQKPRAKRARQ